GELERAVEVERGRRDVGAIEIDVDRRRELGIATGTRRELADEQRQAGRIGIGDAVVDAQIDRRDLRPRVAQQRDVPAVVEGEAPDAQRIRDQAGLLVERREPGVVVTRCDEPDDEREASHLEIVTTPVLRGVLTAVDRAMRGYCGGTLPEFGSKPERDMI